MLTAGDGVLRLRSETAPSSLLFRLRFFSSLSAEPLGSLRDFL